MPSNPHPRIALVYDRVAAEGGAERVLQSLHQAFPDAPLYTSFWNKDQAAWSHDWQVRTSWMQYLPRFLRRYRWLGWAMPFAFESFDLREFDVVISVAAESAKAVVTQPNQLHVCYLLSPTRYLWSHRDTIMESIPKFARGLAQRTCDILAKWDVVVAQRPDIIIPISELVQQRSKQYYQRSTLAPIYPPFTVFEHTQAPDFQPSETFMLSWGRHVQYKRFDLVIQAAVKNKTQLVLAGEGPETRSLRRLAKKLDPKHTYVHMVGKVSDAQLQWYLEHAAGAIFPQLEDFGIVAGEAVAAGCPVLVHKDSGVSEVLTAQNSVKIAEESEKEVRSGMQKLLSKRWDRLDMKRQARQYAGERFVRQWQDKLDRLWNEFSKQ